MRCQRRSVEPAYSSVSSGPSDRAARRASRPCCAPRRRTARPGRRRWSRTSGLVHDDAGRAVQPDAAAQQPGGELEVVVPQEVVGDRQPALAAPVGVDEDGHEARPSGSACSRPPRPRGARRRPTQGFARGVFIGWSRPSVHTTRLATQRGAAARVRARRRRQLRPGRPARARCRRPSATRRSAPCVQSAATARRRSRPRPRCCGSAGRAERAVGRGAREQRRPCRRRRRCRRPPRRTAGGLRRERGQRLGEQLATVLGDDHRDDPRRPGAFRPVVAALRGQHTESRSADSLAA